MADILKITLPDGTTYNIKDNNALPLTGGLVTGPVTFGSSVSIDDLTAGNIIVTGIINLVLGLPWSSITNTPTTLAGYGITDANFLPLSGGTMTGSVTFVGNQSSAYNDKGVIFTKGSRLGENTSGGLGIYAVERVYIRPGSNGSPSSDGVEITTTGLIPSNNNLETLGDSSHKWSNVYATTFTGALSGNATTATKFASAQSIALTGDITGSASSQAGWSIATTLANSGVTANTYGNTSLLTPTYGGTFNIPYFTVDAKGRLTSAGTTTVKIPASDNTDTKQNIILATTSKAYITGVTTTPTSTAQALTGVADTGVYLTATAGEISAVRHSFNVSGTEKAYMVFNSTTNAIDFIFN